MKDYIGFIAALLANQVTKNDYEIRDRFNPNAIKHTIEGRRKHTAEVRATKKNQRRREHLRSLRK